MSERVAKHHGSFFGLILELGLIALGVFLGLLANNWHEEREHRTLALNTLRNFAEEMRANQAAVQRNRQYHETLSAELQVFLLAKNHPQENFDKTVHFLGIRPVIFEQTAFDLALATQALSYLPPDLAFSVARVYTKQKTIQNLEDNFLAGAFTPGALGNPDTTGFAAAMLTYLGDINVQEPEILSDYQKVIPQVEQAIHRSGSR